MGDSNHHNQTAPPATSSRLGIRATAAAAGCGEIVEVQGGHIVRSTGRKDRHSKVCTAKGPRDRRVRLSAHTAIQFYDVQDRLGYDRPSKAVDWLIKKAKTAIDELAELPPWNPAETLTHAAATAKSRRTKDPQPQEQQHHQFNDDVGSASFSGRRSGGSSRTAMVMLVGDEVQQMGDDPNNDTGSGFLPPSMDSDSIADTIKSFFPTGGACGSTEAPPSPLIQNYHPPPNLLSRISSQNQDLRLSLQSFHDPPPLILQHHHHHHDQEAAVGHHTEPVLFSGQNNPLGFDVATAADWEHAHHHHHQNHQPVPEIGRLQRLVAWNSGATADNCGGFVFASPHVTTPFQPLFGQSQIFSQRGTLQSSNTSMIRAWVDHHQPITATDDLPHHHHHHHHHHPYQIPPTSHQSAIPVGFASQSGEFSGFRIPARIQGDEEEHDGISDKPSSASSVSRH